MPTVGIVGASGYAGAELLRLVAGHPQLELAWATGDSQAGKPIATLYPSLAAAYPKQNFEAWTPAMAGSVDAMFLALPHGASTGVVASVLSGASDEAPAPVMIDLGADFRLADPADYVRWYGGPHEHPELLAQAVYSIPEFCRDRVRGARLIANPGCYPTAATFALAPFVRAGVVHADGLVVDAASGVSGAGRPPKDNTTFCTVDEDFTAYGLLSHRHTPEMDQAIGGTVLFTPHLAPMNRGILATCYARVTQAGLDSDAAMALLRAQFDDEPFVVVTEDSPHTKSVAGTNTVHVSARVDQRTGLLVAICAIDNLCRGAAGQAVQNANLALGLDETLGLPIVGVYP